MRRWGDGDGFAHDSHDLDLTDLGGRELRDPLHHNRPPRTVAGCWGHNVHLDRGRRRRSLDR